jgi:hypothetical protein
MRVSAEVQAGSSPMDSVALRSEKTLQVIGVELCCHIKSYPPDFERRQRTSDYSPSDWPGRRENRTGIQQS